MRNESGKADSDLVKARLKGVRLEEERRESQYVRYERGRSSTSPTPSGQQKEQPRGKE